MEYLLFECLQDLTGGDLVFLLGVNSLLVDTTTAEERTTRLLKKHDQAVFFLSFFLTRLVVLDAFRFCGRAAGMQIAAHMKTQVTPISMLFVFFSQDKDERHRGQLSSSRLAGQQSLASTLP